MGSIGIGRTSNFAQHQTNLSQFARVQRDLADLQDQISSGNVSRNFQGLTGNVEQFINLEATVKRTDNYINTNTETIVRVNTVRTAISNTIAIADDMQDLIALRRNPALEDNIAFAQQWEGLISAAARELNVNVGGRFLLGGTRTDTPPVIDPPPSPGELGVADNNHYQGSSDSYSTSPQDGYRIEFDIHADDPAIQELYKAYHLGLEAHANDDDELLGQTLESINAALDGLITLQTRTDAHIVELERINESHESSRLYFTSVVDEIGSVDVVAASTQLALEQTILTASFQAFARISSLSLSDFLN